MAFMIEFHFALNEYFENPVLHKQYLMTCSPEVENPFGFDGPFIYKALGCEINFKPGNFLRFFFN